MWFYIVIGILFLGGYLYRHELYTLIQPILPTVKDIVKLTNPVEIACGYFGATLFQLFIGVFKGNPLVLLFNLIVGVLFVWGWAKLQRKYRAEASRSKWDS